MPKECHRSAVCKCTLYAPTCVYVSLCTGYHLGYAQRDSSINEQIKRMDTCLTINKANPFPTEREEREFADEFGGLYSLVIKKKTIILLSLVFGKRFECISCILLRG